MKMKNNNFKKLRTALLLTLTTSMMGCSSLDTHLVRGYGAPFSGTTLAVASQPCAFRNDSVVDYVFYPLTFIDIPLSLAADVVFLPVDLAMVFTPTTDYRFALTQGCGTHSMI